MRFGKRYWILGFIPLFLFLSNEVSSADEQNEKSKVGYVIHVMHPGQKNEEPKIVELKPLFNELHQIIGYQAEVLSVYCIDRICKVESVKIRWDAVGNYEYFYLDSGVVLEKNRGIAFEEKDYSALHRILNNKQSRLKTINIDDIIDVEDELGDGVDAVSGATTLNLAENDIVKGAALTCYTLWHWANGAISDTIAQITQKEATIQEIRTFLEHEQMTNKLFALNALKKRKHYCSATIQYLKDLSSGSCDQLESAILDYLKEAPINVYFERCFSIINDGDASFRLKTLRSLLEYHKEVDTGLWQQLVPYFEVLEKYQEIDLLFRIIEEHIPNNIAAKDAALRLLYRDIFVARRAYWFLQGKELNDCEYQQLKHFELKHREYL